MSKPQGIIRPLGLALVLAAGAWAVYALVGCWGLVIWESLQRYARTFESLKVAADGRPLIQRIVYDSGQQSVTFRALDGSDVPGEDWLSSASLPVPVPKRLAFPMMGYSRVRVFADPQTPAIMWYFLHNGARDGRGYFVGYDSYSKLSVGFIGRGGWRPDEPPAGDWFPMDEVSFASGRHGYYYGQNDADRGEDGDSFPGWKDYMISGTDVLEVDLRRRSVTTVMESDGLISIGILETATKSKAAGEGSPHSKHRQRLAVRTTDRVVVFDAPGKQYAAYRLPDELRDKGFEFYEIGAGSALVAVGQGLPAYCLGESLFWIDSAGNILRRAEVALDQGVHYSKETEAWQAALGFPCPCVIAAVALVTPFMEVLNGAAPNYPTALLHSLAVFWPPLLVVTLLSAAMAWYCFRRHARYGQPHGAVWFMFVLLTGLPGLVGYLFHRRWPVLENCPHCGQSVPRDREICAHCREAFPLPALKGSEVFA
jgi:hypothetical protein